MEPIGCPCCSGPAEVIQLFEDDAAEVFVKCTRCGLSTGPHKSRELAITAWNTRNGVPQASVPGVPMPPAQDWACKVCGNIPDAQGSRKHGRGCYTQSEDGGGEDYIEEADTTREPPIVQRIGDTATASSTQGASRVPQETTEGVNP
jgi:hypothetical protein